MKEEIRGFGDDPLIGVGDPCQRQFQSFLTDLLRDPFDPLFNQIRRVAPIGSFRDAAFNHCLKNGEKGERRSLRRECISKTAQSFQVTHGSARPRPHQQGVPIAIRAHGHEREGIARCLAFCPQRRGIHIAQHQYGAAVDVLHDCRQESSAFTEVEVLDVGQGERRTKVHVRISSPAARSSRFKSPIPIAPE